MSEGWLPEKSVPVCTQAELDERIERSNTPVEQPDDSEES
jgi:hypothetical protein